MTTTTFIFFCGTVYIFQCKKLFTLEGRFRIIAKKKTTREKENLHIRFGENMRIQMNKTFVVKSNR